MVRFQKIILGSFTAVPLLMSCATGAEFERDRYTETYQYGDETVTDRSRIPPPYATTLPPKPSFEFERAPNPGLAAPGFVERTSTDLEQERTARLLAEYQRQHGLVREIQQPVTRAPVMQQIQTIPSEMQTFTVIDDRIVRSEDVIQYSQPVQMQQSYIQQPVQQGYVQQSSSYTTTFQPVSGQTVQSSPQYTTQVSDGYQANMPLSVQQELMRGDPGLVRETDRRQTVTSSNWNAHVSPRSNAQIVPNYVAGQTGNVVMTGAVTENVSQVPITDARTYYSNQNGAYHDASALAPSGVIPPLPPARAGECYALIRQPEQYRTVTRQYVAEPAYERFETMPAQYQSGTQTVVTAEAYDRMEIIPATFKTVTETVLLRPAMTQYTTTEPVYQNVSERVMVQPARQVWKNGRGKTEKMDPRTGEILCLVEEPAVYKTLTKKALVKPAEVREVQVPPQYQTISRRVIDQPAQVRRVTVPQQTGQVNVHQLVKPSEVRRVQVPAKMATMQARELVSPMTLTWRSVLCATNMTPDLVRRVQSALKRAGHNPGPIDGVLGNQTMRAVNAYQKANGLPQDSYLNIETARRLGVAP